MGETPDDIREEIEATRERMGDTVEALGYKADVKSRVKDSVSNKKDSLVGAVSGGKDAVVGKADSMVSRVGGIVPDGEQVKGGAAKVGVSKENRSVSPSPAQPSDFSSARFSRRRPLKTRSWARSRTRSRTRSRKRDTRRSTAASQSPKTQSAPPRDRPGSRAIRSTADERSLQDKAQEVSRFQPDRTAGAGVNSPAPSSTQPAGRACRSSECGVVTSDPCLQCGILQRQRPGRGQSYGDLAVSVAGSAWAGRFGVFPFCSRGSSRVRLLSEERGFRCGSSLCRMCSPSS